MDKNNHTIVFMKRWAAKSISEDTLRQLKLVTHMYQTYLDVIWNIKKSSLSMEEQKSEIKESRYNIWL